MDLPPASGKKRLSSVRPRISPTCDSGVERELGEPLELSGGRAGENASGLLEVVQCLLAAPKPKGDSTDVELAKAAEGRELGACPIGVPEQLLVPAEELRCESQGGL